VLVLTGRTYLLATGLIGQLTTMARPALGQMLGRGERERALSTYRSISASSVAMAVVAATGLLIVNRSFVATWVGPKNYGGFWLDAFLAANVILRAWLMPCRALLTAALVAKQPVYARVVEGVINLTLSVIFARYFGLAGVVAGTTIAAFLTTLWYLPGLVQKTLGEKTLLRKDNARMALITLTTIAFALGVRHLIDDASFVPSAIVACVAATMVASAFWFGSLPEETRVRVRGLVGSTAAVLTRGRGRR
jgi:O-antigen/teichoic acid export membrane protein